MDLAEIGIRADVTQLQKAVRELNKLADQGERTESRVSGSMKTIGVSFSSLTTTIASAVSANKIIDYADSWKQASAQLRQVTDSGSELLTVQMQLAGVADNTRSSLESTISLYASLDRATESLGLSSKNVLGITETINNLFLAGGASSASAAAGITQLSQAFASGVLRGDEFNSVAENAPKILDALTAKLGKTRGELRAMAEGGKLTAKVLAEALIDYSDEAQRLADTTEKTFGQSMQSASNNAIEFVGNSKVLNSAVDGIASSIEFASENLDEFAAAAAAVSIVVGVRLVSSMAAAATASIAAAGAAGTASAALAAIGGPAGAAILAGAAIYYFATSATDAEKAVEKLNPSLDGLSERFNALGSAQKKLVSKQYLKDIEDQKKLVDELTYSVGWLSKASAGSLKGREFLGLGGLDEAQAELEQAKSKLSDLQKQFNEMNPPNAKFEEWFNGIISVDRAMGVLVANTGDGVRKIWSMFDKPPKTEVISDEFKKLSAEIEKQIALFGKEGKASELAYDIQHGNIKGLTSAQAEQLIARQKYNDAQEKGLEKQKEKYESLNESIKEHVALMSSMESDINAGIDKSFEKNMTNLNESFDAAAENSKTLDDMIKKADEFGGAWSRTGSIIVDAFGSIADSLEDYTKKMEELRIQKEAADNFKPTNAIDEIKNEKLKIKLAEESTKAQIGGYGKIAGAAATMFSEQSKARKALNNAEKVFTAIEIGLALQKAAANATSAITAAFAAPWPIGFASGAAMIAIMAGLGVFSGSSGGGGPSAADIQETQGTGTNLGDSSGKSDSISNAFDEYSDIALDQLAELRGIRSAMNSLSDGISGVAVSLVRGGKFDGANVAGLGTRSNWDISNEALGKLDIFGIAQKPLDALFGTTTKKIKDTGLQIGSQSLGDIIAGDFEVFYYNTVETTKKKLFGLYKKVTTKDVLAGADGDLSEQLSDIFVYLGSAVSGSLDVLGVDAANAIEAFQVNIGKISFKDLSGDEIQAELEAIFGAQADLLASYVLPQIEEYQRMGEGAFETLMRVSKEQAVFDDALEKMGISLSGLSGLIRLDVAQSIIDLMGGLEEFSSKTSTYFEKFFREDEKIKMLGDSLKEAFGSVGQSVPATREAFRAIVEGIDYTSESGQYLFASLMELAPSLDQYISAIEKEAAAKEKATTATKDYAAIANKQADLQIQLMESQGLATEALAARRSRELSLLDESLRPLQEQIWAQQDLNKAMDATNANIKRVADERYNLETRLLQAQGNTQALRERELAALDASNRPLQEQIWALEAKAEADASAAQSAQDAADAQQRAHDEAVQAAKDAAEEQARLIKGTQDALTGAIRKLRGESEQLNDLDRQRAKNTLNAALAAAQAGQSIVGFAGLEDALTAVSNIDKSAFVSAEDYQRELARTLSILDRLSGYAGMPTSSTTPIISNGALAMQTQTNQQMAQNMAAVEDKMTDLTVKIEENTKRTKMMLERWESIGMPASRA